MSIKQNITSLQSLLEQVNALPEAGVELPELTNQAKASELFLNKELIDGNGNKVTGTFTIDNELSEQNNLIVQIQAALEGKAGNGGGSTPEGTITIEDNGTYNVTNYAIAEVALPETEQAIPTISVSTGGLITASTTQTAGLVEAGTKSATKQLTTKSAQTYTPTTTNQTISSGRYLTGTQTIKGDANLVASNIKKDVSIFGVTGTLETGSAPSLQSKTISPTGTDQTVTPDSGYDGLSQVTVNAISNTYVGSGITRQAAKTVTPGTSAKTAVASNTYTTGAVTVAGDSDLVAGNIKKGISIFGVTGTLETDSDPVLQSKTVSPSTSSQTVKPDSGYDGLSQVTVNAISTVTRANTTISSTADDTNDRLTITASNNQGSGYVTGSNKTASTTVTLTTSGATATMSDGTNSVSKSVASGSAQTPTTTITANPTLSTTATTNGYQMSVSATKSVTPTVTAGYISSGTAGTITVSGSAYVPAGSCTVSGGGLTAGAGSAAATGTGITLGTATTTKPTSGKYITVTGSGSVSRAAIKDSHTAGYIPAKSATTVISSTSKSSNTATTYYPIASTVVDTATGDATAAQILSGKKAWVDGVEITGTAAILNAQSKTVSPSTSSQTIKPDSGYNALSQVTVNAMATATQATPSITVSSSGLITASATQTAGYVSAGTKSKTQQLATLGAKTVTPSTNSQTAVASNTYTTGAITVAGDANLVAENIKNGVSIFGVTGTMPAGVTVQTKSGSFTTNYSGTATVNCGFKPDFVAINGGTVPSGSSAGTKIFNGAAFTAGNTTSSNLTITPTNSSTHAMTHVKMTQTSTGFSVNAKNLTASWSESNCSNRTINYVAIKYT